MKLIATQTLTSAQPSITFSSIPANFTDLIAVFACRSTRTGFPIASFQVSINGTSTNESSRNLRAFTNLSPTSGSESSITFGHMPSADNTSNTFSNVSAYFANYSAATAKGISIDATSETNNTADYSHENGIYAGLWNNTAAINSFSVTPDTGNFAIGSTVSLYGIGGAGDGYGAPKATGGSVVYRDGYWYHTFTSSGTFVANSNIPDAEILVVAGGGSGGAYYAGGGGAGGVSYKSAGLVSAGSYTATVGAGGAGVVGPAFGNSGSSSSILGITSNGGGGGGRWNSGTGGVGLDGGSGGGGSMGNAAGDTRAGGAATQGGTGGATGYGNAGGTGYRGSGTSFRGGGGGGAGAAGTSTPINNNVDPGSNGGDGLNTWSSWLNVLSLGVSGFIAGGGGASSEGSVPGAGGAGGGGRGTFSGGTTAVSGTVNTGSGGGADGAYGGTTGAGGSGLIIVRYAA